MNRQSDAFYGCTYIHSTREFSKLSFEGVDERKAMIEFWPTLNSVFNGDAEEQKAPYFLSHSICNLLRNPKVLKTNQTHNKFKHTS